MMSDSDQLPVLIVGDVHGDLERLFQALKPYPADRWRTIFLGDLIDGGPFGVGALRYARDRPNSTVLLGNHEVLTLAALRDRRERGRDFLFWLGAGGQLHDLQELARDEGLQQWMRNLPALVMLEDRTLVQHCDNDGYSRFAAHDEPDVVGAVNEAVCRLLVADETDLLWELMTAQHVFQRQPMRLASWLQRTGARRVVHGHTPHGRKEPVMYGGGRALNFDGGLARRHPRAPISPLRASVGPLPP
jgi:calcineurin-like phosphoesterase family protein